MLEQRFSKCDLKNILDFFEVLWGQLEETGMHMGIVVVGRGTGFISQPIPLGSSPFLLYELHVHAQFRVSKHN